MSAARTYRPDGALRTSGMGKERTNGGNSSFPSVINHAGSHVR